MARGNSYEVLAREAAERMDQAQAAGEQLDLLGGIDDGAAADPASEGCDAGAARRGKGRAQSQLREWLASKGHRMPEDVLAQVAGLTSREDVVLQAMRRAEQLVAWAYADKVRLVGKEYIEAKPSASVMLDTFKLVYGSMIRGAEALMPYGLPKSPDVAIQQATTIVMQGGDGGPRGAVVEGAATAPGRRTSPPPMPADIARNQRVSGGGSEGGS